MKAAPVNLGPTSPASFLKDTLAAIKRRFVDLAPENGSDFVIFALAPATGGGGFAAAGGGDGYGVGGGDDAPPAAAAAAAAATATSNVNQADVDELVRPSRSTRLAATHRRHMLHAAARYTCVANNCFWSLPCGHASTLMRCDGITADDDQRVLG